MLTSIRFRWLRGIVRFTLSLLASICGAAALIGVVYLALENMSSLYRPSSKQQLLFIENVLGISFITVLLILWSWNRIRRLRREHANQLYRRGNELARQQRYEGALAAYEQAIKVVPKFLYAWLGKGGILFHLRRYEDALGAHEQAVALSPLRRKTWTEKGAILVWLGRYEEAIADFDHALAIDPTDSGAWRDKAVTLDDRLKRHEEAIAVCDAAQNQGVETASLWAIRGDALHALRREEEARAAYDRVLTYPADDLLSWSSHGIAHAGIGQYHEALAAYEQALVFWPDYPQVLHRKAGVLRALGREDEALESEQQADELDL